MTFIEQIRPIVEQENCGTGILSSVILAQAILESDSGKSELARNANNLFGVKKGSGWMGEIYTKMTQERTKEGKTVQVVAEFRKYPSWRDSIKDLIQKYTKGTGWEKHNRYEPILSITEYREATAFLLKVGYATDPKYPEKLNAIIEKLNQEEHKMTVKLVLDAGHSKLDTPGKQTPNGIKEWVFNDKILRACEAVLKGYQGVEVLRTDDPTGRTDVPLRTRTDKANKWGADAFVSFHNNALIGKWGDHAGAESFIHPTSSAADLQKVLHAEMLKETKNPNRGMKQANFQVLRETKMKAVLLEFFFMDSKSDYQKLINDTILKNVGEAIARGLVSFYKLKKKAAPAPAPKPAANARFQVEVLVDTLNWYDKPRWTAPSGTVKKGTVLTIAEEITVDGGKQYRTISGTYITSSPKYVKKR